MHPTSTTSTSYQPNSSHMAQHVLLLISVFLLYVSNFHLHKRFMSWGLVSDTILIKFIFLLLCNMFWRKTANHSQAEITAGCSKYCCDDPVRHEFSVVHRNPYAFCSQRQYYSSGENKQINKQTKKQAKKTRNKHDIWITCVSKVSGLAAVDVLLSCGAHWSGVRGRSRCPSQKPCGVFSHSPTCTTVSMCLAHQPDWIAKLFLQQVMDTILGYASLMYVKASQSFEGLVDMSINATFISYLQQMKFRLFWLKNLT